MAHENLFATIANATPPGQYANRLALGPNNEATDHLVILTRYGVKPSEQNKTKLIIEADFMIEESSVHKPGDQRGWAWFPGSDKYGYAEGRAQTFIKAVADSFGDTRDVTQIGSEMVAPHQPARGTVLRAHVEPVVAKGAVGPDGQLYTKEGKLVRRNAQGYRLDDKNQVMSEVTWSAVPQDGAQLAMLRQKLDALDAQKPAPQQQVAPQQYQTAPAQGGFGQQAPAQTAPQGMQVQPGGFGQQPMQNQVPAQGGFGQQAPAQTQAPQTQAAPTAGAPVGGILGTLRGPQ